MTGVTMTPEERDRYLFSARTIQIRVEEYEALLRAARAKVELQFSKQELEIIFYCIASMPLLAVENIDEHLQLRNKICLAMMEADK